MAEICDSIKHDRQKTTWAVRDCAKAGLLSMRRDDVTGQPGYALTADGKQRLAEGPGSKQDELNRRDDELLAQASTIVDLRSQLETLQREAMRGASLMSGQDRYTAAGYLVRASKRKPRTLLDKDKARDAALSSIRAGAQRAEVFALVPIGHARRGAEWRPS